MRVLRLLIAVVLLLCLPAAAGELPESVRDLPSGEEWLAHFVRDILPYWSSPEALGQPVGRYPTAGIVSSSSSEPR